MRPTSLPRALLALWLVPAGAALAQDPLREGRRPAAERSAQEAAGEAARESSAAPAKAGGEPTYEEVLASPDDVDLNYRFALGQVRRGELRGASATLERILMLQPDLAKVRLLRALVLYRLENLDEAQRELDTLKGIQLSPDLRQTADEYRSEIRRRRRATRLTGRLGLGFEHDTNRNAAPSTGKALFIGRDIQLAGDALRRSDQSLITIAGVEARHKLESQAGHELFASYGFYRQDQRSVPEVDLQAHSLQAGAQLRLPGVQLSPALDFDHVSLARATYLVDRGASVQASRKLSQRTEGVAGLAYQYQDYRRTRGVGAADERSGPQWDGTLGLNVSLGSTMRLSPAAGLGQKLAAKEYNAYRRYTLGVTHTWLLGRGLFLLSSLHAYYDRYDKPDTVISPQLRSDDAYRARATAGLPLANVGLPVKDLVATATLEWFHVLSNIQNYAYDNNKLMLMLNYRWEALR